MDEKVKQADQVFVAEAVRLYFVDANYDEAGPPTQKGQRKAAALVLRVVKLLYPRSSGAPDEVIAQWVSSVNELPEHEAELLGKRLIYFTCEQTIRHFRDREGKLVARERPLVRHYLVRTDALRGPTANPIQMSYLSQVEESVRARAEGLPGPGSKCK